MILLIDEKRKVDASINLATSCSWFLRHLIYIWYAIQCVSIQLVIIKKLIRRYCNLKIMNPRVLIPVHI